MRMCFRTLEPVFGEEIWRFAIDLPKICQRFALLFSSEGCDWWDGVGFWFDLV